MQWKDINFAPTRRTLRQFAALWLLFFGALAAWHGWLRERHTLGVVLGVLAVVGGVAGLIWPRALRWVYVGWMVAAYPIGWTISRLVLAGVYYGLFTPIAVVFRVRGRDALRLRHPPSAETYWQPKAAPAGVGSYLKQF